MTKLRLCTNRQEWDDFVLENNGHPLQLWGWGELKSAHGWRVDRLFMIDNQNEVVAGAQLLVRKLPWPLKSIAYIPRGPITDENIVEELLNEIARYAKEVYHSVCLSIEPDLEKFVIPTGWKKSPNHILPSKTIILDLNESDAELMSEMDKKTRQYIRKSASEDIKIKKVHTKEELIKCLDLYKATAKRAKFGLHNDQYYYDIFEKLKDHSPIFAVFIDDDPIAFLWLAISADTAFELYGGVNETGQRLRVNYALKWHAILKCKEWGLARYDFAGLIEGGVSTFKKGWAEEETKLAGTFDRPLSLFYGIWSIGFPGFKKIIRGIKSLIGKK